MNKIFFLLAAILLTLSSNAQSYWQIQNESGEELLLTIQINTSNHTFVAHTRKDALKEMAGTFTYMLAKTAGKLKYPEIVHSEGTITYLADTTFYNGNFEYLDKSFPLKAKSWKNSFLGQLTDNKNRTHPLTGVSVPSDSPLRDYASLINKAFVLTEQTCWDAKLVQSAEWTSFKSKVNELKYRIADDYEMGAVIFWYGKKIALAPYEIRKINKRESEPKAKRSYSARELKPNVAYIDLSELPVEKADMDELFREIQRKTYSILILDARGRKNLQLVSAALLANHLTPKPADWGVYLTRKWLDSNGSIPNPSEYSRNFKNASALPENNINLLADKGFYLKPDLAPSRFSGKIYLLMDNRTSRLAESLAIWFKSDKLATLVGQKTSGFPMLYENILLTPQYRINIPTAQFYDKQGKCWMGIGVEPDLPVQEDQLSYVLKL